MVNAKTKKRDFPVCLDSYASFTACQRKLVRNLKNFDRAKFLIDLNKLIKKTKNSYMLDENFTVHSVFNQFLNAFSRILNFLAPLRPQTRNEIRLKKKNRKQTTVFEIY